MINPNHRKSFIEFIKFSVIGVLNTIVDFGILNLLHGIFGLHLILSNTISTLIAIFMSYCLNRRFTFRYSQKSNPIWKFAQFLIVSLIGLALNDLILFFLAEKLFFNYNLGKLIATCIVLFWNFFINKLWTFKTTSDPV